MFLRTFCVATLLLVALTASMPASAIIIDSFDDTQLLSGPPNTTMNDTVAGSMFGGQREFDFNTGVTGSVQVLVNDGGSGQMDVSHDAADHADGNVSITYDSASGIDLTSGGAHNAIMVDAPSLSHGGLQIGVDIVNGTEFSWSRETFQVPSPTSPSGTAFIFLFGDPERHVPDPLPATHFQSVNRLNFILFSVWDDSAYVFESIETIYYSEEGGIDPGPGDPGPGDPNPGVPEPSTYVMAVFGLLGLGLFGWRRKRA